MNRRVQAVAPHLVVAEQMELEDVSEIQLDGSLAARQSSP